MRPRAPGVYLVVVDSCQRVTAGVPDEIGVIAVTGELTIASGYGLPVEVSEMLLREGLRRIVIDLDAVEFIDSSGLGLLLNVQRRVDRAGARLAIVEPPERVRRVFEITRLDQQMTLVATRAAALAVFAALKRS